MLHHSLVLDAPFQGGWGLLVTWQYTEERVVT